MHQQNHKTNRRSSNGDIDPSDLALKKFFESTITDPKMLVLCGLHGEVVQFVEARISELERAGGGVTCDLVLGAKHLKRFLVDLIAAWKILSFMIDEKPVQIRELERLQITLDDNLKPAVNNLKKAVNNPGGNDLLIIADSDWKSGLDADKWAREVKDWIKKKGIHSNMPTKSSVRTVANSTASALGKCYDTETKRNFLGPVWSTFQVCRDVIVAMTKLRFELVCAAIEHDKFVTKIISSQPSYADIVAKRPMGMPRENRMPPGIDKIKALRPKVARRRPRKKPDATPLPVSGPLGFT
jgi:hypothetical protein